MNIKLIAKLQTAFDTHPKVNAFHITADEQIFESLNHAEYHGKKLKDKGVATVTRTDLKVEQAPAGDRSLAHPEATFPTAVEVAAQKAANQALQAKLDAAFEAAKDKSDGLAKNADPENSQEAADELKAARIAKGLATKAANREAKAVKAAVTFPIPTAQPEAGTDQKA